MVDSLKFLHSIFFNYIIIVLMMLSKSFNENYNFLLKYLNSLKLNVETL